MQFAYQFPEKTERMVLVARRRRAAVSPLLRAATLPGAQALLSACVCPAPGSRSNAAVSLLERLDTGLGLDAADLRGSMDALPDATARAAFIRTLRAVVDWRGQVVTMLDRCYLVRAMPTMLMLGLARQRSADRARLPGHAAMPGSRLEVFDGRRALPLPHRPASVRQRPRGLLARTTPSQWGVDDWRELLREGRPAAVRRTESPRYREPLRRSASARPPSAERPHASSAAASPSRAEANHAMRRRITSPTPSSHIRAHPPPRCSAAHCITA